MLVKGEQVLSHLYLPKLKFVINKHKQSKTQQTNDILSESFCLFGKEA